MTTYGPFYASSISADGWSNPNSAKTEDGSSATWPAVTTGDIVASGFGASIASGQRVKKVVVGVKASGTVTSGQANIAFDCLQLQVSGSQVGDTELHGVPLSTSLGWHEAAFDDGVDLSPSEAMEIGVLACFYDSLGAEGNSGEVRVDAFRVTVYAE